MRCKPFLFLVSGLFLAAGFFACATPSSEPSLTLPNVPQTIHVGDTVITGPATKKSADLSGRMMTDTIFSSYYLTSDNTVILGILGAKVIGKSAGTTTFSATANDGSGLVSAKYSVTVH